MSLFDRNMPLTDLLQSWLDKNEWEDPIEIDPDQTNSRIATACEINGQNCRLYIEVEEEVAWISAYLYSPFLISEARLSDACMLANEANARIGFGRMAIINYTLQYKVLVDLEGSQGTVSMIDNMVGAGQAAFQEWLGAFGKLEFTTETVSSLVDEVNSQLTETRRMQGTSTH